MNGLCEFVKEYPAWVRADGKPLSWTVYVYGMSRLPRLHAIQNIRMAEAAAVAFAGGDAWKEYHAVQRRIAGL